MYSKLLFLRSFQRRSILLALILLYSLTGFSQNSKEISGIVANKQHEPLVGVTVAVEGTTAGTTTDQDGSYSITIPKGGEVLVFSYVGFSTRKIPIKGSNVINVTLEMNTASLQDVVVVGYGSQKRVDVTGAISTIDAKMLENRPVNNVAGALQGTAPGLVVTRTSGQPGDEGIQIQIRGVSSVNGTTNPLLVVDGIITPLSELQTMNPNDVESVNVLKDAASTAIYGAQGAGGVILVTTKSGGTGSAKFEYSTMMGIKWPLNSRPKRLTLLEEALYSNLAHENMGALPEYDDYDLEKIREGVATAPSPNIPGHLRYYTRANKKIPLVLRRNNFTQRHNLSVKGGTDKFHYLFSAGYYDETGILKVGPDGLKRYNFRLNESNQITKHLTFESHLSYTLGKIKSPTVSADGSGYGSLFFQMFRFRQRYPIWTETGKLNGYGTGDYTYATLTEGGYDNVDHHYFDGTFKLKYNDFIIKGLQLEAIYGSQYRVNRRNEFFRKITLYWVDDPIRYFNNPNRYEVTNNTVKNNNLQFLANYDLELNKNNFHLLLGYQWLDSYGSSLFSSATNLVSNDLPALNLGPTSGKDSKEDIEQYAYQSLFGRLNYNYANKYLFQFSIRRDKSSRLAPRLRTSYFPSVSVGWNLNYESWFNRLFPFFSMFKPRFSWGEVGSSIGIGDYDFLNLLSSKNNLILGDPKERATYFYQSTVPSSTLTWETIRTSDAGLDFGIFENRIQASADIYVKHNNNMLTPINLPATFGVGTPLVNLGKLKTWGWEVEVSYRNKIEKKVHYSIAFNLSNSKNELIEYSGRQVILPGFDHVIEGYPINSLWGYRTDGYFQTATEVGNWAFQNELTSAGDVKYLDLNKDEKIDAGKGTIKDHGDLVFLGTVQPHYTFGITGSINWNNLDFSFFLQGVAKRKFYPNKTGVQPMPASYIQPLRFELDYWTPKNPNAAFPRPYIGDNFNYLASDRRVLDGKYIRLKNIQLGYSIPANLLDKIKIEKVRIFFSAQDILTFSGLGIYKDLFDPETKDTQATGTAYPYFASATLGLNITF